MSVFKELKIESENELEHLIVHNPLLVEEEEMRILGHQVPTNSGKRVDILAVDSDDGLVVIELKIVEDTYMLPQGLEYIDWVNENAERIKEMYNDQKISVDVQQIPRLLLIAPSFSQTLRKAAKYVAGDYCSLQLLEYHYLETDKKEKGLFLKEIHIDPIEAPIERWEIKDYIEYFEDEKVQQLFTELMDEILNIGPKIESIPTQSWYIGLQYKNRNLATLSPRKKWFYLAVPGEGEWDYNKIQTKTDLTDEMMQSIVSYYKKLGGKPRP